MRGQVWGTRKRRGKRVHGNYESVEIKSVCEANKMDKNGVQQVKKEREKEGERVRRGTRKETRRVLREKNECVKLIR